MTLPLKDLRVLELATGVAGPYAGRLLVMLGATVVKAEPPGGDPARDFAVDDKPFQRPGPVFVHLNAGKRLVGRERLTEALRWADVVLDDGGLTLPTTALVVTVTPGIDTSDELEVQAASGLLAISQDGEGVPLRFPGWQSQYLAGAYAAAAVLAGLAQGCRHADVTWIEAMRTAFESHAAGILYTATSPSPHDAGEAARNAGHLARTYPSGVFACADGHVIPGTVRAEDWLRQCEVYGRPELPYDPRFVWAHRWDNRHLLAEELRPWYAARGKREIFQAALEAGWAAAMVLTATDALTDPHLVQRGFFSTVSGAAQGIVAGRPWRSPHLPENEPVRMSSLDGDAEWFDPALPRCAEPPAPPHPRRLKVLELTLAWAGPLAGRFLGSLGADVVRIEVGNRPDGWRTRQRWHELGVPIPPGTDPDECTWDASAQFNSLNRAKRAISLDLATPQGAQVFLELASTSDVLIVNMSHDVLAKRGVEDPVRQLSREGLVVITMPALGASGPYKEMAGYGMLTEGMGGFAARYGHLTEQARASYVYYPDAVAGIHGVVAVLAALAGRRLHGQGDWIDLSQQETMWLQLGEGLVLASREGRDPGRSGAADPALVRGIEPGEGTEELDHPVMGKRAYLALPTRFDGTRMRCPRPAPLFDQHTDEVLAQWLGYDAERIAGLRAANAAGTKPVQPRRRSARKS